MPIAAVQHHRHSLACMREAPLTPRPKPRYETPEFDGRPMVDLPNAAGNPQTRQDRQGLRQWVSKRPRPGKTRFNDIPKGHRDDRSFHR